MESHSRRQPSLKSLTLFIIEIIKWRQNTWRIQQRMNVKINYVAISCNGSSLINSALSCFLLARSQHRLRKNAAAADAAKVKSGFENNETIAVQLIRFRARSCESLFNMNSLIISTFKSMIKSWKELNRMILLRAFSVVNDTRLTARRMT